MNLRSRLFPCKSLLVLGAVFALLTSCNESTSEVRVYGGNTGTKNVETKTASTTEDPFVTRSGSSLLLNGKPFRFSGANLFWLGLQNVGDAIFYPSHFTVDDGLATASFMGATVVRSHTLGISVGCRLCVEPSLGKFNQTALQQIDYAIESAKMHNLKLIIPLVDNWHYYHGGKHTFTDWRGISDEDQFYSDPQVINDFKQYVRTILNHKNVYTGITYKDDPTIMAWETGNELTAPSDWVQTIATYIKEVDNHHLVMDGNQPSQLPSDLDIPNVDLYTAHYGSYPPTISTLDTQINETTYAGKAFVVGEYDWNTTRGDSLSDFLSFIEHSNLAGDLYWSLFPHNDNYGFVRHNEHYTLHYPGETSDMRQRTSLIRAHAYAMQGLLVPTDAVPGTPSITAVDGKAIAWQGAFGAATYTVERSTKGADGPWTVICNRCATDLSTPWTDARQPVGPLAYRVKGYSVSGTEGPYSNVFSVS